MHKSAACTACTALVWGVLAGGGGAAPGVAPIPYADARAVVAALADALPAALKGKTPAQIEAAWPAWVSRHNTEIRARLEGGDEDSIVNLWYYGTTFTKLPRLSARNVAKLDGDARATERLIQGRLDDLIAGIESPGSNERLEFARDVIERKAIDPATAAGKEQVRRFLLQANRRVLAERENRERRVQATKRLNDPTAELSANYTLYLDRGLSSDTSMFSSFSIDVALEAFASNRTLAAGSVTRAAIIGPGLDFTDKADGYDFYPQQTIQPFALVDSLMRLGLARPNALQLTTFDLSARINQHIENAVRRARGGGPYVLQLPLDRDERWNPAVVAYWERFGRQIGEAAPAIRAPSDAGNVEVRAIAVRPDVVTTVTPQTLNIVLEQLPSLAPGEQYDLIIATNILVYYDLFDQNLALANVARMLRPGGFFLSNTRVSPAIPLTLLDDYVPVTHRDGEGDHMFWYRRQ